jgi:hypothetical protein
MANATMTILRQAQCNREAAKETQGKRLEKPAELPAELSSLR